MGVSTSATLEDTVRTLAISLLLSTISSLILLHLSTTYRSAYEAAQEHSFRHVRSAPVRLSELRRASTSQDAEHRPDRGDGREVLARLRAIADLRRIPHE